MYDDARAVRLRNNPTLLDDDPEKNVAVLDVDETADFGFSATAPVPEDARQELVKVLAVTSPRGDGTVTGSYLRMWSGVRAAMPRRNAAKATLSEARFQKNVTDAVTHLVFRPAAEGRV